MGQRKQKKNQAVHKISTVLEVLTVPVTAVDQYVITTTKSGCDRIESSDSS